MKLNGKTVLITGASSGIGEAIAYRAAKDEATIILTARRIDKLEKVKKQVEELGGKAEVIECDVTKPDQIKKMFLGATKNGRVIDVIFNNAGLGYIAKIKDLSVEEIAQIIDVNVKGMAWVSKYASEILTRQQYGHLFITASLASFVSLPEWSAYTASKWAVRGFADCIRLELKPLGVKVTTIHPGAVKTEFFDKNKANVDIKELGQSITADQVAEAAYRAIFTNKRKVLVPGTTKAYAILSNYFPWLVDMLISLQTKKLKYHNDPEKAQGDKDFSYIKPVKNTK